jgi:hypothetical protein
MTTSEEKADELLREHQERRRRGIAQKPLPRYVEYNHRNGNLSFRAYRGACTPLPNDPTSLDFRAAYSAALVDAIAMENDDE